MNKPITKILSRDEFIEKLKEGGAYDFWVEAGYMKYLDDEQSEEKEEVMKS